MPVLIAHNVMLQRNMLYVGITREEPKMEQKGMGEAYGKTETSAGGGI